MRRLYISLLLPLFVSSTLSAQFYSLPAGDGLVNDVSDNGIAVGSFGSPEYFMWSIGDVGKVNIGGVPAGNGVGGQAKISNDGSFVSGVILNSESGFHEMSRYEVDAEQWTALGGLGSSSGGEISSAWNVSGDGESIVGLAWVNAGQTHAAHWRDGVVNDLGTTMAGNSSRANAVNFDGSVIAGWQDGAGRQGAVWVDGVQELIFELNGQPAQEASEITNDGRYAVGFGIGPFNGVGNAYRYDVQTDTYLSLPNLSPGGMRNMAAATITDDGSIVGGGTWGFGVPASFGDGLIWEQGVGTLPVEDYLISKGASGWPNGFIFHFVSGISSDGNWIVGWGGTGVIANQSWAVRLPKSTLLGDVNQDGKVNLLDVAPFVELIQNSQFQEEADINQDGVVDLLDVNPFVDLLVG